MCHVSCLWFNDKRVLIFSHRNNYIFGAKHYLRKVRLVSAKLWVYWAESYCGLTWPGHAEITVSLTFWFQKLITVSTVYAILHPETILCIFWILSLIIVKQSNTTVFGTQCYTVQVHVNEKFRMNRSLTKPFLLKTSYIYLPFDITIVIHSKHPRKAELYTNPQFYCYVNSKIVWDSFFKSGFVLKFINQ